MAEAAAAAGNEKKEEKVIIDENVRKWEERTTSKMERPKPWPEPPTEKSDKKEE